MLEQRLINEDEYFQMIKDAKEETFIVQLWSSYLKD